MARPLKKLSSKRIIREITRIRSRNNRLWMSLLALAVTAKPRAARGIIGKISANDLQVTRWLSRL